MKPCMASAGALRGVPLSITTTERRERASISAAFSPAAPPPITTASTVSLGSASRAYAEVCTDISSRPFCRVRPQPIRAIYVRH
jgi:hypothetical protein